MGSKHSKTLARKVHFAQTPGELEREEGASHIKKRKITPLGLSLPSVEPGAYLSEDYLLPQPIYSGEETPVLLPVHVEHHQAILNLLHTMNYDFTKEKVIPQQTINLYQARQYHVPVYSQQQ